MIIVTFILVLLFVLTISSLVDIADLRHARIRNHHARSSRYQPTITIALTTPGGGGHIIKSIKALEKNPYRHIRIIAIIPAPRTSKSFRLVARYARTSRLPIKLVADRRRQPLSQLLPRYISRGLLLILPYDHTLTAESLNTAIAYLRDRRVSAVTLTPINRMPSHISDALLSLYYLAQRLQTHISPATYWTPYTPGVIFRASDTTGRGTHWHTATPLLDSPAQPFASSRILTIAGSLLLLPLIYIAYGNSPEVGLAIMCSTLPLIYLTSRVSHLLGVPVLTRVSLSLLAPIAFFISGAYHLRQALRRRHA